MLAKKYNHLEVERGKYQSWLALDLFKAGDLDKPPFCIVLPPPNITGRLHLGHALNGTIQDVIIRYKKMNGFDTLWLPGMDHAGIATQAVIDEKLKQEGINPRLMKREQWLKQAWLWKDEYAKIIREQWAKLGLSLDYSKERFTLDKGLNDAVNYVFVNLYEQGLIYRGESIINFDPKAMTALSNIEVIYKEVAGSFHYLKYKIEGSNQFILVATTRIETIFGDVAVAVHPNDKRYHHLIGKEVIIPLVNRKIPVIADLEVDINLGSGALKITPAHDFNDFEIGKRHRLKRIICINNDGTMNKVTGKYKGLDRFECRELLLNELKEEKLLIKTESITHAVGYSERSGAIIEPLLSKQWFVKASLLANKALENQKSKDLKVNFIPSRFEKIFINWLNDIQDWCISRQLWWGHQIPAWYKGDRLYVGIRPPQEGGWVQDEDVLDTWFSSALWPFTTLGWPNKLDDRYFPNSVLVTGYDIIFFWVSRMIFQSLIFTNQRPFKDVIINGLIRDKDGLKMSKSLGNGIDPMDVIDTYGADSLRFFLTTNGALGQDLRYDEEKVISTWNFINKLWNASRFVFLNLSEFNVDNYQLNNLSIIDKWLLSKLTKVIKTVSKHMERYDFNVVGSTLYSFIWDDFCDWYIELSKFSIEKDSTKSVLIYTLNTILKMLHPFMPFVTEEIYKQNPFYEKPLLLSAYPKCDYKIKDEKEVLQVKKLIDIITQIRAIRQTNKIIKPYYLINQLDKEASFLIDEYKEVIEKLTKVTIIPKLGSNMKTLSLSFAYGNLIIAYLTSENKVIQEIKSLTSQKDLLITNLKKRTALLLDNEYLTKAPSFIIKREKEKKIADEERLSKIEERLIELKDLENSN